MIIANLKREINFKDIDISTKQKEVFGEKAAFTSLHEAYLIMQYHNEESLVLRLQTETRLKQLFNKERQRDEVLRKLEEERREERKVIVEKDAKVEELEAKLIKITDEMRVVLVNHKIKQNELVTKKRNLGIAQQKNYDMEEPYLLLKAEQTKWVAKAEMAAAESNTARVKADVLQSQVDPLVN